MFGAFVAAAWAGVSVRDLPAEGFPETVAFDPVHERLVVDGEAVRGGRRAQLEWLRATYGDDETLDLDRREAALRTERVALGAATGVDVAALAVAIAFPPSLALTVPLCVAVTGTNVTSGVVAWRARRALDAEGLAVAVARVHAVDAGLASAEHP